MFKFCIRHFFVNHRLSTLNWIMWKNILINWFSFSFLSFNLSSKSFAQIVIHSLHILNEIFHFCSFGVKTFECVEIYIFIRCRWRSWIKRWSKNRDFCSNQKSFSMSCIWMNHKKFSIKHFRLRHWSNRNRWWRFWNMTRARSKNSSIWDRDALLSLHENDWKPRESVQNHSCVKPHQNRERSSCFHENNKSWWSWILMFFEVQTSASRWIVIRSFNVIIHDRNEYSQNAIYMRVVLHKSKLFTYPREPSG